MPPGLTTRGLFDCHIRENRNPNAGLPHKIIGRNLFDRGSAEI